MEPAHPTRGEIRGPAASRQNSCLPGVTAGLAAVDMSDAVGLGELLDAVGYNYQETRYPAGHAKFPRRFIFGSENSHDYRAWAAVSDTAYVGGQFLWTGIDCLGEAHQWPNRAADFDLLDPCVFKKPAAWFRQPICGGGAASPHFSHSKVLGSIVRRRPRQDVAEHCREMRAKSKTARRFCH
jgi:hypothetical protein